MASSITPYAHYWDLIASKGAALYSTTIKVALITSSYTFSAAHTIFDPGTNNSADPSYNEVPNGSGYTTGGVALANPVASSGVLTFDNPTWTGLTATYRAGIFYFSDTIDSKVNPLIAYYLPDTTPADIAVVSADWVLAIDQVYGLFYNPDA